MSYFLAESEKKRVKLVSGDRVAEGTLREISASRHKRLYDAIMSFTNEQDLFNAEKQSYEAATEAFLASKNDPESVKSYEGSVDKHSNALKRLIEFLPKHYRECADIMIHFDNGLPDLAFFESDDFEYVYLLRLRDFFLNLQRNLSGV